MILQAQQRSRHHRYPIRATICLRSGCDDRGVDQVVSDLIAKPEEISHVAVVDTTAQFDLQSKDFSVVSFDNQVNLSRASRSPQVSNRRFRCLGVNSDRESHERFKEMSEQCSIPWDWRTIFYTTEQRINSYSEQPGCQRRVGQVMLWGAG